MDTLDMIVHCACFVCWYAVGTLIAADFILIVPVIHSLLLFCGAKASIF